MSNYAYKTKPNILSLPTTYKQPQSRISSKLFVSINSILALFPFVIRTMPTTSTQRQTHLTLNSPATHINRFQNLPNSEGHLTQRGHTNTILEVHLQYPLRFLSLKNVKAHKHNPNSRKLLYPFIPNPPKKKTRGSNSNDIYVSTNIKQ